MAVLPEGAVSRDRAGQVWIYRFHDGSDRVCLITSSVQNGDHIAFHTLLNLDFQLRRDLEGLTDFTFERNLTRHWERVS